MRKNNFWRLPVGMLAVAVLLLSNSVMVFAAPQAQATGAARAVNGRLAFPTFDDTDEQLTDFNDLHLLKGLGAVKESIDAAKPPHLAEVV